MSETGRGEGGSSQVTTHLNRFPQILASKLIQRRQVMYQRHQLIARFGWRSMYHNGMPEVLQEELANATSRTWARLRAAA
jgi:hypothetical protein